MSDRDLPPQATTSTAADDVGSPGPSSPRGRSSFIPLSQPQENTNPHPPPRSIFMHNRSHSEGTAADGRRRSMNRVKFTVGDPGSESDENGAPSDGCEIIQQPPPLIHYSRPGSPSGESTENSAESLASLAGRVSLASTPINSQVSLLHETRSSEGTESGEKKKAIHGAYERAQRLASIIRRPSYESRGRKGFSRHRGGSIPTESDGMEDLEKQAYVSDDDEDEDNFVVEDTSQRNIEALDLVRSMTKRDFEPLSRVPAARNDLPSGQVTPIEDPDEYVARPTHFKGGILSNLLRMYGQKEEQDHIGLPFIQPPNRKLSPPSSRRSSSQPPRPKWYDKSSNRSTASLTNFSPKQSRSSSAAGLRGERPTFHRSRSSGGIVGLAKHKLGSKARLEDEIRLTVHIAEILARQRYLVKLCRALMRYGAPTHRLEEYMRMTARVLEIDGHFLYIPGVMIMAFDDTRTHTTEVKMIKSPQAVDLGRLRDVHIIYKEVVHDIIGVEEAMQRLDETMQAKPKFNVYWLILFYGCASATVGPFAFEARPIDMPISFILGALLAVLQHVIAPRSEHYANVFEISAAVLTSFLARAFGSIKKSDDTYLFCYSALAQSSIALILPGYIVLCGALELQSRNIVAGSVRMVYAIIYSLFLGFGIMVGTTIYGLIAQDATFEYSCPPSPINNTYLQRFPFIILFALCLCLINQAKWKQIPTMVLIAFTGYVVNFFSTRRFANNTQIASALGAFAIGIMGNLYSRLRHGLAAAAILPAIFVQVPSGLASSGSLVSGLIMAENVKAGANSTQPLTSSAESWAVNASSAAIERADEMLQKIAANKAYGSVVFDIGYGMLQIAIGITVGLFMAALVVYPLGKRRSGLFSF
ncbi:hypothetical protein FQN50_004536 [Emmonsiellopsis sp. PD_5]|nr:hypothetical protein FQN50_004536 [Emmonsiellopsis sp. PD_5]